MNDNTEAATLTDFLLARIAEDEDAARGVNRGLFNSRVALLPGDLYGLFIRQHPERVLAECRAKRRIVDYREQDARDSAATGAPIFEARVSAYDAALRALATAYADHPEYRDEWRP